MPTIHRIDDLTLDTGRQRVLRGGKELTLGPLTYKLLLLLAEKAPNVATHDEIAEGVWHGRAVSPETVKQRVKLLRDALGDDAAQPRYVERARGFGYRLIPPVFDAETAAAHPRRARTPFFAVIGVLSAAALTWWIGSSEPGPAGNGVSVAVLSFADVSPEQGYEYFAEGVSEEIRNSLSKIPSLKVVGRTSTFAFRESGEDPATIAKTLQVSHVLEGAVRRRDDRVRVMARLIDVANGTRVWSDAFEEDVSDIATVQATIVTSVANALGAGLLIENVLATTESQRVNSEAFDLYLRGQHQVRMYTEASFVRAGKYFEQAIRLDPEFIPAYYSLGFLYVLQAIDIQVPIAEARASLRDIVNRGLALAPDNPGLIALSGQLARYDGDNDLAERRLRRAAKADPSNLTIHMLNAIFVHDRGYPEKSLEVLGRALEIDPLNPLLITGVAYCNIDLWKADEALAAASHLREISNGSELPVLAVIKQLLLGDLAGSVRDSREFMRGIVPETEAAYGFPLAYFDLGDVESGDAAMRLLRRYESDTVALEAIGVQQMLAHGDIDGARARAIDLLQNSEGYAGYWNNYVVARLATDALIDRGDAELAVSLVESLAPVYASYKVRSDIDAQEFSPAPFTVKSNYSTFPAVYFPDYIHALRAAGDERAADNMLGHLDAILHLRRQRGLYLEERYAAEAHALRGNLEDALDALEQAEKDRTIYHNWQLFLLHNSMFSEIRDHSRFRALVERVRLEMARQLAQLADE